MKIMIFNFNNVLTEVKRELIKRGHKIIEPKFKNGLTCNVKDCDTLVVWTEIEAGGWRNLVKEAKKLGKKVVLIQHGRYGTSRIFPPFNEELLSDYICVWGENDKQRYLSVGTPEKKIKVTGTTVLSKLKPKIIHEWKNVVFCPEHWDIDVVENAIVHGQLMKLKGVNLITKCLKGEHYENYTNPVFSDRAEENHLDICAEVLSKADIVVSVSESTFELMAEIMDIPVIIADYWIPKASGGDERYKIYNRIYTKACTRVKDLTKLNDEIYYQLKHPEILREERKEIAIGDGGINIDNPLEKICNVIEGIDL